MVKGTTMQASPVVGYRVPTAMQASPVVGHRQRAHLFYDKMIRALYRTGTTQSICWILLPSYPLKIIFPLFLHVIFWRWKPEQFPWLKILCFLFTWWLVPEHLGHAFTYAFWEQLRSVLSFPWLWQPIFPRLRSTYKGSIINTMTLFRYINLKI